MSTWTTPLSSILSSTTSRYASLRRNLLSSSREDDDASISSTQDSHVSCVLRAYYTEKGRPFPQWLGVDSRTAAAQAAGQQNPGGEGAGGRPGMQGRMAGFVSSAGSLRRGANGGTPPPGSINNVPGSGTGRGGGLGDIWGSSGATSQPAEPASQSLRRGAAAKLGASRGGGGLQVPGSGSDGGEGQQQARPLPSQRAGSYQTRNEFGGTGGMGDGGGSRPTSGSGPGSVQDRLRARLGARGMSNSSAGSEDSSSGYGSSNPYGGGRDDGGQNRRYGLPNGPRIR